MTSNELAVRQGGSDLAIESDQTFWSEKQIAALRQLGMGNATNGDLAVFFHQATRTGLDPFARQIYMIQRQGKQTIQTGIDGFRLIARRATDRSNGSFGYEDTLWCGEDGQWLDVWLNREHPRAAKVTVIRDGARYPAVALWDEYVGTKTGGEITQMWATKGALMLAKCAEALALRRAFPQDLSGLYTADEMQQADGTPRADAQPGRGADRARAALGVSQTGGSEGSPAETSVAEGEAGSSPAGNPSEPSSEGITAAQIRKLGAAMKDAGLTERAAALEYVAKVIGREVSSRNELTKTEASRVIDALEDGRGGDVEAQAAGGYGEGEGAVRAAPSPTPPDPDADGVVDAEIVPDEGDADAVWQRILAVGGARGMSLGAILDDFPTQMGGLDQDQATAGELLAYLDKLNAREDVPA